MARRVVLAYSGGLDTSVAVRWMQEEWGVEVTLVELKVPTGPEKLPCAWSPSDSVMVTTCAGSPSMIEMDENG